MTQDARVPADDGWGPQVEWRGRSYRSLRVLGWLAAILLVLAVAVPLLALSRIPRVPVDGLASSGSPVHVLVVGSDSREALSEQEQAELSTGSGDEIGGERTDTIFVLSVDGSRAALLAFPRDLWVPRCDGSVGRINVAQSIGGPGCLVDTVHQLSGIRVQHYARVTFAGFRDVVDAVGGVELCLDEAIRDADAGIDLPAGCQRLDGADALGFVRVRKIDDDLHRIQRQQQFLRALADEVASPWTLLNPVRLWSLSRDAGGAVTLDEEVGPLSAVTLARGARGLAAGDVPAHTVPAEPDVTSGGASVLRVRESEAEALFARFRDGSVLEQPTTGPDRAEVPVTVLNGAGVAGLASATREELVALGYEEVEIGNAPARDASVIRHPRGDLAAAERLAADLPVSPGLEVAEVPSVTLVLGADAGAG